MKKKYFIALFGLVFGLNISSQTTLKVMSFNIHAGYDASMEQLASFIKEQNPDIVALQEVEYYTDRSKAKNPRPGNNNINMLGELSSLTGMQGMYYVSLENIYNGKFGNAILSKYSFSETYRIMLPCIAGTEQRCAAIAKIALPDNTDIRIVGTHLDMSDSDNGLNQIREINKIPQDDMLYIVAGDINKRTGTTHISELSKVWKLDLSQGFDHIGHYPSGRWKVKETKVFSDNTLSDHYPIMVTYELQK